MPKKKATPEELTAAVELQLSQRRFILESINTGAALLQVPLVTAGIWYYLSRTNPALGALNKAILAAELAPIIGDIQFPEGVLLGAAMESTEDFLNILDGAGLLDAEEIIKKAHQTTIDTGDWVAEFFMPKGMKLKSCEDLNLKLWNAHLAATGRIDGPEGVGPDPALDDLDVLQVAAHKASGVYDFGFTFKAMKMNGCEKPTHPYFASDEMWAEI